LRSGSKGSIRFHSVSLSRQLSSFVASPIVVSLQDRDGSFIGRNAIY
jgi:hypothetical protein